MHFIFKSRQISGQDGSTFEPYFLDADQEQALATTDVRAFYTHAGLEELFKAIPQKEQYNLHLTLWRSEIGITTTLQDGRAIWGRNCIDLPLLAWDIDDVLEQERDQVIEATLQALNLNQDMLAVVHSGNGLHFVLPLETPLTREQVKERLNQYKITCSNIQQKLFEKGLSGTVDTHCFQENATLRLPNTTNLKNGTAKHCKLIHEMPDKPHDFQWPDSKDGFGENFVPTTELAPIDVPSVLSGCEFLKHCKANADTLSEPEWYAMINILAFMPQGEKLVHEYSSPHPGYSQRETDSKIRQARRLTGPRTCKNISQTFSGCQQCPHFGKVRSPVQIHDEDFVLTAHTGYWFLSKDGKPSKPDYDGLLVEFQKEFKYITIEERDQIFTWNGTHYDNMSRTRVLSWVEHKMYPKPMENQRQEFLKKLFLRNQRPMDFFTSTTKNKINLANGVLDLKTMELLPHSEEFGFLNVHPFPYDKEATCPKFDKFLYEIMLGRQDCIDFLWEWFAYCLENGPIWQEKAVFFIGEGANGKSTLITIMKNVFGRDTLSYANSADLNREYYRVRLEGSKLNISEETPSKNAMASYIFKALTTSESEISAREPYGKEFTFTNRCKLLFLGNHMPQTDDKTDGFMRRLIFIPFDRTFQEHERDYHLVEKILPEGAGIFNKLVQALQTLRKRGRLLPPKAHELAMEEYREDNDFIHTFLKTRIEVTGSEKDYIPCEQIYAEYIEHVRSILGRDTNNTASQQWITRRILQKLKGKVTRIRITKGEDRFKQALTGLKLMSYGQAAQKNEVTKGLKG